MIAPGGWTKKDYTTTVLPLPARGDFWLSPADNLVINSQLDGYLDPIGASELLALPSD